MYCPLYAYFFSSSWRTQRLTDYVEIHYDDPQLFNLRSELKLREESWITFLTAKCGY